MIAYTTCNIVWWMCSRENYCRLVDVQTTRLVHTCLRWCFMQLAYLACQMHTCHVSACRPWLILYAIAGHFLPNTHISHQCMQSLAEIVRHWLSSLARYAHAIQDTGWTWLMFFILADICILICAGYAWCWKATFDVSRLICACYGWCLQAMFEVSRPMSVVYGRCCQVMFDVDKPMCAGYRKCLKVTYHVGLLFCEGQRRWGRQCLISPDCCLNVMGDLGSRCPTMDERCAQATKYACSPQATPGTNDGGSPRPK